MSQIASFLYNHEIAKLSNALFNHQFSETDFFNSRLVNYLNSYLPFDYVAAVIYNDKLEYVSVADHVGMHFSDHSYATFWQKDKCGRYISQYLLNRNIAFLKAPMMFKSTDIIASGEYEHSNYVSYLNNQLALYYSVSLPFGLNGRFRLVFYKKKGHGDFSDLELELLNSVYTMIVSSNHSFENIQSRKEASRLKSELLSECNMGVLILNEDLELLDYNSLAVVVLQRLTNYMDIHGASSYLVRNILNLRKEQPPISLCRNGYEITVISKIDFGQPGAYKKYYMVYIKNCAAASQAGTSAPEKTLDSLTRRETEIVKCLSEGMTYQEISESLFISLSTVRKHIQNIFSKLGINNQRKLVSLYLRTRGNGV